MASSDQSDQQNQNGAQIREDAAPVKDAAPRETLIATAVRFLHNQKVRQSPLATRKAFLKKKGLTDEEVELAIQRVGSTDELLAVTVPGPGHIIHPLPLSPVPYTGPPGYRWRHYGALAVIMAGMAFGFHHLYRKYILPLIMGSKEDKKHLQKIENNIADMSGTLTQTVTQLQMTLTSVQELLVQQQKKIQELSQELANSQASSTTNCMLESQSISELKAEIVSLKGLLLSRRQFPASPSIPKIPSWQIPLKPGSPSNPPSVNHTNSSSDISPVSNESTNSSPVKESDSSQATPSDSHCLNGDLGMGSMLPLDLKDRMEIQGEEEKKDEAEEDDDVTHVDEEDLSVHTEDRRGGDGQIRRPEGASNDSEVD